MPTDIEHAYCQLGCRLPEGATLDMVAERRARWAIGPIFVPVTVAQGCAGWGMPHIRGVPLGPS